MTGSEKSKIFRIDGCFSSLSKEEFSGTLSMLDNADAFYAWIGSSEEGLSREQLSVMAGSDKPFFVADSDGEKDRMSRIACGARKVNYLGRCASNEDGFTLTEKCLPYVGFPGIKIHYSDNLRNLLNKSGSQIEERLAVHLSNELDTFICIESQAPISINGKHYRADFMISASWTELKVIVEADGHDFHERTKEQAAKDRSRDREMLASGYAVMRFTGSEIHNGARECAVEVKRFWENNC